MTPELRERIERLGKKAVLKFGATSQINIFQEECAEVIVAISHLRRHRVDLRAVASEIADVIIMSEQARFCAHNMAALVEEEITKKLDRLEALLEPRKEVDHD